MIFVARRKKKRGIGLKKILVVLFWIIIVGGGFYYVLQMPIHNIYIKGNQIVSDDEIINLAKLDTYPSFLLTSGKSIKNRLEKNQYIEDIIVKKKFGNIVIISVYEYKMIALTKEDNKIILSNGKQIDNKIQPFHQR